MSGDLEAADAPDPLVGRVIAGKLELLEVLGSGAMGVVYRARHRALDKTVAIKVLSSDAHGDISRARRFQAEARAASRLDHPHGVQILDFGEDGPDGLLYIAMELLEGEDLQAVLKREGKLEPVRACRIVMQTLAALAAAHEKGVLHRDLKPGNIMLLSRSDDEGEGHDFIKVCDFGLAKLLDGVNDASGAPLTKQGTIFGTPAYMSPEQVRGDPLDARSDLYACGVILYRMLTGQLPFTGDAAWGLLMKHLTEPVVPPRQIAPELPPELEAIVLKSLEKTPEARFQTAREMRSALKTFLRDASVDPALDDVPSRPGSAARAVSTSGGTHAASTSGAAHAVSTSGATPAVSTSGAARAVSTSGATHAVSTSGATHVAGHGAGTAPPEAAPPPASREVRAATVLETMPPSDASQSVGVRQKRSAAPWIAGALSIVAAAGVAVLVRAPPESEAVSVSALVEEPGPPASNSEVSAPRSEASAPRTEAPRRVDPRESDPEKAAPSRGGRAKPGRHAPAASAEPKPAPHAQPGTDARPLMDAGPGMDAGRVPAASPALGAPPAAPPQEPAPAPAPPPAAKVEPSAPPAPAKTLAVEPAPKRAPEEPKRLAPGFTVDVELTKLMIRGGVSTKRTEDSLQRYLGPIAACLQKALLAKGVEAQGVVQVRAAVDVRGSLKKIDVSGGVSGANACIEEVLRAARLQQAPDTGETTLSFVLRYRTR
ncbi:MAG: protein kinase [Deltaproteobacteria bacterium]|nr:protein kinase [Deltaproteobacteria bacterium]